MRFTDLSPFERDVLVAVGEIEQLLRLALPRARRPVGVTIGELRTRLFMRAAEEEAIRQALLRLEREGFAVRVETADHEEGWSRVGKLLARA